MLIDKGAYICSMLQIYSALIALSIVFPLIMWRDYLKGKSGIYRFLFCIITQNVYNANLVLLLGYFNIACRLTVFLGLFFEYIIVRWCTKWRYSDESIREKLISFGKTVSDRHRRKKLIRHKFLSLKLSFVRAKKQGKFRPAFGTVFVALCLAAAVIYNIIYINHNVNGIGHSYQFSDIPVHLSWVYYLGHGNLFSSGIYPFYMHSNIFCVWVLSQINLREILLYFGSFQTVLLVPCVYCFAKRIFSNKYIALLPVLFFSLLLNNSRYSASLPQECGMFAVLALGYFLTEFLSSERQPHRVEGDTKKRGIRRLNAYFFRKYITVDVLMIMLCVALVIGYHFYTAIAAIFLVLSFCIAYVTRIFRKQYLMPLFVAGILGVVIAVTPFAACLAKGIPFQGSMAWATSIIKGETWVNEEQENYLDNLNNLQGKPQEEESEQGGETQQPAVTPEEIETEEQETDNRSFSEKLSDFIERFKTAELHFGGVLYGAESAVLMFMCMAAAVVSGLLFLPFRKLRCTSFNYVSIALYCFFISLLGVAPELELISIVDSGRASVFIQPVLFILYAIPADILLRAVKAMCRNHFGRAREVLAVVLSLACGIGVIKVGWMHSYFGVDLIYYNECEYVLRKIRNEFPDFTYIVVSPTDEYYDVVDHAYHTELSEFMYMVDGGKEEFVFQSEYVFFFVEKKVLKDNFRGSVEVSPEYAKDKFIFTGVTQDYSYQRATLESKAYYWAEEFKRIYPNNVTDYFEDDIYKVYLLRQNPKYPFSAKIDYLSTLE